MSKIIYREDGENYDFKIVRIFEKNYFIITVGIYSCIDY